MRTLYIHCGLPKTGTTSIQTFLARTREGLESIDYDYPSVGLNAIGNAHHNLTLDILESPAFAPDRGGVESFLRHLERPGRSANTIISSENFITSLNRLPQGDERFIEFVRATKARNDRVCLIFMFRRFSAFFESMYLQKLKAGRPNSKIADYTAECKQWLRSLFRALSILNDEFGAENIALVDPQRSGGDALAIFLSTVGISQSAFELPKGRLNEKLGLKKSSYLYRFQYASEGVRNQRTAKDVLRTGKALTKMPDLSGEVFDYRIIPFEDADAIQEVARSEMPGAFAEALGNLATPEPAPYASVHLSKVLLTASEISAMTRALPLYLYLSRQNKNGGATATDAETIMGS
jgi:hypothetical protein